MAPKKEALTKDEKTLLVMAAGLCVLKTAIELELPLASLRDSELVEAGKKLLVGTAISFGDLLSSAKERGALPKLREAVEKAKRVTMGGKK